MDKGTVQEKIDLGFKEGKKQIELGGTTLHLLPFGQSFKGISSQDEFVIYNDLYLKQPNFFTDQVLKRTGNINEVDASKAKVKEISKDIFEAFCSQNHFKKGTNSKLRYGLFLDDRLLIVAGFSKPKKAYQNDRKILKADLYRVVFRNTTVVTNGLTKLVNYFMNNYGVTELTASVSNEFENISDYLNTGFKIKKEYKPGFHWLFEETNERFSTGQLLKKGLIREESLERMVHPPKGYLPISDMGSKEMVLTQN